MTNSTKSAGVSASQTRATIVSPSRLKQTCIVRARPILSDTAPASRRLKPFASGNAISSVRKWPAGRPYWAASNFICAANRSTTEIVTLNET